MKKITILLFMDFIFSSALFSQNTSTNNNYQKYSNNAISLTLSGDYSKAIAEINKSIKLKSNNTNIYYLRANISKNE